MTDCSLAWFLQKCPLHWPGREGMHKNGTQTQSTDTALGDELKPKAKKSEDKLKMLITK